MCASVCVSCASSEYEQCCGGVDFVWQMLEMPVTKRRMAMTMPEAMVMAMLRPNRLCTQRTRPAQGTTLVSCPASSTSLPSVGPHVPVACACVPLAQTKKRESEGVSEGVSEWMCESGLKAVENLHRS